MRPRPNGNGVRRHRVSILACLAAAGVASAATVVWDGGPNGMGCTWSTSDAANWAGDANPTANDEALFPVGTTAATVWVNTSETVRRLTFENTHTFNLRQNGNSVLTLTDLLFRDMNAAPGTNVLHGLYRLGGNAEWCIEGAKTIAVSGTLDADGEAHALTKTGTGTLLLQGATSYTGNTVVAEGTLLIAAYNAQLKGMCIAVGDGVHPATLDVAVATQQLLGVPAGAIVTVNTNGLYRLNSPAAPLTFYPETYVLNGGTFDLGGNSLYMYNVASTPDRLMSITMTGGTITNGFVSLPGPSNDYPMLTTKASSAAAVFAATLSFGGYRSTVTVEDGEAPVDLDVTGELRGNMVFRKTGAGTMALSRPAGSIAYRVNYSYLLDEGTLLVDNVTGTGTGSNGVTVAGSAILGGTGTIYGPQNQAHVTLAGISDLALATLAPGTLDRQTGSKVCGTLTLGNAGDASVTNNVTFGNFSRLRVQIAGGGTGDRLAVHGNLYLNSATSTDVLSVVTAGAGLPAGVHTLATWSGTLAGRFDTVTLNGDPLPSNCKLEYRDAAGVAMTGVGNVAGGGSIVLTVPPLQTTIVVR